jgi:hypothetical protein
VSSELMDSSLAARSATSQPIVDDVCDRTCCALCSSDLFSEELISAIRGLLDTERDRLKPAQILETLAESVGEAQ